MLTRRNFLIGAVAAPAIVKFSSLMPVKLWEPELWLDPETPKIVAALNHVYHGGEFTEVVAMEPALYANDPLLTFLAQFGRKTGDDRVLIPIKGRITVPVRPAMYSAHDPTGLESLPRRKL